jgi:hypothetical protein
MIVGRDAMSVTAISNLSAGSLATSGFRRGMAGWRVGRRHRHRAIRYECNPMARSKSFRISAALVSLASPFFCVPRITVAADPPEFADEFDDLSRPTPAIIPLETARNVPCLLCLP